MQQADTLKPTVLNAAELPEWTNAELRALFNVLDLPKDPDAAAAFLAKHGHEVRGIALRKTKIDVAFLDAVPAVEIISSYSAGLDNLDVQAARSRGITIENTSHILAEDVANAAVGLALAVTRDFINADAFVRTGTWPEHGQYPLGRSISRMKVGIVGLGTIGSAIAKRLQADGLEVVPLLEMGATVDKILETAERIDAELIAVGSHSHRAVHDLVVGSVSKALLKRSTRTLLIVPLQAAP